MAVTRALLLVAALASTARADRFYMGGSFGAASYKGELRAFGSGGARDQFEVGYRRGPWAAELVGGAVFSWAEYNCFSDDCALDPNHGEYAFTGAEVRYRWPLVESRYSGFGLRFALHGGPRIYWGTTALTGYDGVGASGGAALEGDGWVLGYYLDVGIDAMVMRVEEDTLTSAATYAAIGARLGWL